MTLPKVQEPAGAEGPPSPYRWVILFIDWIAFLLSFIDRLAWANVAVSVGESLGLAVAALGAFVTAFYFGYVMSNAIGGSQTYPTQTD
jgi:sugar phosphate permease